MIKETLHKFRLVEKWGQAGGGDTNGKDRVRLGAVLHREPETEAYHSCHVICTGSYDA